MFEVDIVAVAEAFGFPTWAFVVLVMGLVALKKLSDIQKTVNKRLTDLQVTVNTLSQRVAKLEGFVQGRHNLAEGERKSDG